MSGYNPKTGIFSLNASKARRYWRRPIDPTISAPDWRGYCAELFRRSGFTVLRQTPYGIDIVADDADVWEVLSGCDATWGRADPPAKDVYERWQAKRQWFNATDLGKALSPAIGPAKVNRLLERLGYQVKLDDVWQPTPLAAGMYQLREGAQLYRHGDRGIPVWHRSTIDLLQPLVIVKAKPSAPK